MDTNIWWWVGFNAFVLAMLAIDLGIFHRKAHAVTVREAAIWSSVWVAMSLAVNFLIYQSFGRQLGLEFLTGYVIEYSLSVDNIFVFVLLFSYFRVPARYQHRVLFWGIIGALLMRGAMIGAGSMLIARFHWIIYVFGAFLVVTGIRMATQDEGDIEPEANPVLKLLRKTLPVTNRYHDQSFFVREERHGVMRTVATPLFVVLVLVETTDLIFAVDSIPAIFAVTKHPFIVYSSNICAILGLRSLYFLLAGVIHKFHFLKVGLSVVLVFIGSKMLLSEVFEIPIAISLGVVIGIIALAVVASLMFPKKVAEEAPAHADPTHQPDTDVAPIASSDDDEEQLPTPGVR